MPLMPHHNHLCLTEGGLEIIISKLNRIKSAIELCVYAFSNFYRTAIIQYRIRKGFDDDKRYFIDPSRRFRTIDGVEFAVCHQWGTQFDRFREYVGDKLGWTIDEVKG